MDRSKHFNPQPTNPLRSPSGDDVRCDPRRVERWHTAEKLANNSGSSWTCNSRCSQRYYPVNFVDVPTYSTVPIGCDCSWSSLWPVACFTRSNHTSYVDKGISTRPGHVEALEVGLCHSCDIWYILYIWYGHTHILYIYIYISERDHRHYNYDNRWDSWATFESCQSLHMLAGSAQKQKIPRQQSLWTKNKRYTIDYYMLLYWILIYTAIHHRFVS